MNMYIAFGSAPAKTLREAALVPEVRSTVMRWAQKSADCKDQGVLVGGLALSFYARPRQTMDVDLLVKNVESLDIPEGFKEARQNAVLDKDTQVEIELVTPALVGIPEWMADRVIRTAWELPVGVANMRFSAGLRVASLDSMIVLKLYGADNPKRRRQDEADIQAMLEHNPGLNIEGLIESWSLSKKHAETLMDIYYAAGA